MKKILSLLVAALLIVSLAACAMAEGKPFEGQTLTISTFKFNAELLQKNIYDPFMEMTGCTIVADGASNAQRVTKIIESPDDYDVVVIGDLFVQQLMEAGVIDTFDTSLLTNLDGLYETARAPMGEGYGPAYTLNRLGIVYDAAYEGFIATPGVPHTIYQCAGAKTCAIEVRSFNLLLGQAHVVGTPGSGFGPSGEGYFRLTGFGTREDTQEALRRIARL